MSGILSKIEALDDVEDDAVEAVDAAVSRVFGAPELGVEQKPVVRPDPRQSTSAPASTDVATERGVPMPPIGARPSPQTRKPEAPKPRSGPRPNLSTTRETRPEAPAAAKPAPPSAPRVPVAPQTPSTDDKAVLAAKAEAALKAPTKGGRVPPRYANVRNKPNPQRSNRQHHYQLKIRKPLHRIFSHARLSRSPLKHLQKGKLPHRSGVSRCRNHCDRSNRQQSLSKTLRRPLKSYPGRLRRKPRHRKLCLAR